MKDKYLLKNWSWSHYFGYLIMHGNVYGNFKFKDGTSIHTSNVVNIVDCGDHKEIETRNSIYCIYPEDINKDFVEYSAYICSEDAYNDLRNNNY